MKLHNWTGNLRSLFKKELFALIGACAFIRSNMIVSVAELAGFQIKKIIIVT